MIWLPISEAKPDTPYRLMIGKRPVDGIYIKRGGEWFSTHGRRLCCTPTECKEVEQ